MWLWNTCLVGDVSKWHPIRCSLWVGYVLSLSIWSDSCGWCWSSFEADCNSLWMHSSYQCIVNALLFVSWYLFTEETKLKRCFFYAYLFTYLPSDSYDSNLQGLGWCDLIRLNRKSKRSTKTKPNQIETVINWKHHGLVCCMVGCPKFDFSLYRTDKCGNLTDVDHGIHGTNDCSAKMNSQLGCCISGLDIIHFHIYYPNIRKQVGFEG